ncbi:MULTISPECIES: hypothetical protein [unclassified Flavobacterium]|uniref:hypothetical protein n=1 Tax=unclassified Flavobacterium TaxID=196869 RepID=UPI001F142DE5|nr:MULTISPECIES: hypothetical protein [unclassified Flavobacterium]UMY66246.1 hypothetical protein MKO97_02380 [Flavobacterium sp. HJ-32-4]
MKPRFSRIVLPLCASLAFNFGFGQSAENKKIRDLLAETQRNYAAAGAFSVDTRYSLKIGEDVCESHTGGLIVDGKNYYLRIAQTEFVGIANRFLKIDGVNHLMQLVPDDSAPVIINLETTLSHFENGTLAETAQEWVCTLLAPKYTSVPYGKAVIYIDKKTRLIRRQILFLSIKSSCKNKAGKIVTGFSKIDVVFSNFLRGNVKTDKLELSRYIRSRNGRYIPAVNYKDFTIVD